MSTVYTADCDRRVRGGWWNKRLCVSTSIAGGEPCLDVDASDGEYSCTLSRDTVQSLVHALQAWLDETAPPK